MVCGHGEPLPAWIKKACAAHITRDATLFHDRERALNALVREGGLADESHKVDDRGPAYLEAMVIVNNYCSWIKRYLWRFTGVDPDNPQFYFNIYLYLIRVKCDDARWPKIARVVRHLLMTDAVFRS